MTIINTLPEHIDADDLMTLAWTLPLRTEHIVKHERAYALLEQEGQQMRVRL